MDYELLVCKKVSLDRFVNESYCGKNHILALVEEGSFRFHCGKGWEEAHPLEAVNFKEGVLIFGLFGDGILGRESLDGSRRPGAVLCGTRFGAG